MWKITIYYSGWQKKSLASDIYLFISQRISDLVWRRDYSLIMLIMTHCSSVGVCGLIVLRISDTQVGRRGKNAVNLWPNLCRWCFAVVLGGGNWGSWNHWSLCSKTCDSGWQRRFRMCEGTGVQGYPCDGSGEEVRSCNEKKCPGQWLHSLRERERDMVFFLCFCLRYFFSVWLHLKKMLLANREHERVYLCVPMSALVMQNWSDSQLFASHAKTSIQFQNCTLLLFISIMSVSLCQFTSSLF